MARDARAFMAQMRADDPELQAEYDRLKPRFDVIRQMISAREAAGLSQRELAQRIGVSQPIIGRLETGKNSPTIDMLAKVAAGIDYDVIVQLKPRRAKRAAATPMRAATAQSARSVAAKASAKPKVRAAARAKGRSAGSASVRQSK